MSDFEKSGPFAVLRDAEGRIVHKQLDKGTPRRNWKHYARLKTNDGADMLDVMVAIARGEPFQVEVTMPTGEKMLSEPQVPNATQRHTAAKDVFEFIHGKAPVATEVRKADEEASAVEQLRALSDEELERYLERAENPSIGPGPEVDAEIVEPVKLLNVEYKADREAWARALAAQEYEGLAYDPEET